MNLQTICCILNFVGLIAVIICIVVLFSKVNKKNENFGDAPAASPYPQGKGPHILLTDDNGNMTKDDNSATLTSWVNEQIKTAIKKLQDSIYGNAVQTTTIQNLIDSIHQCVLLSDTTYMRYGDTFTFNTDGGPEVAIAPKGYLMKYNPKWFDPVGGHGMKKLKFNASK